MNGAEVEAYMTLAEAKKILGITWGLLYRLLQTGQIPVYDTARNYRELDRTTIDESVRGLRVLPSDLRRYMQNQRVD